MDIGKQIRTRREELGLTLADLGDAIGTTRQTIHKYETGVITNIPPDKIEALAKVLKTTPAHLMGWTDMLIATVGKDYVDSYINNKLGYSHASDSDGDDDPFDQILDIMLELSDDGQKQLINYGQFLLEKEK